MTPDADAAHPAFAKMFVQTEFVHESGTLLATRRSREPSEKPLWAAHIGVLEGDAVGTLQFETDRARFLGRGQEVRQPVSVLDARPLSNTAGTVLDPVLALRHRVRVPPRQTVRVAFWTVVGHSRAEALALADKFRDVAAFDRTKTLAQTHAQTQLQRLGIDAQEAEIFQLIANGILYSDASMRAGRDLLDRNELGQGSLWPYGISGDLPIVLLRVHGDGDLGAVEQMLRAQAFWRSKQLTVDVVIVDDMPRPGAQPSAIDAATTAAAAAAAAGTQPTGPRQGIFVARRCGAGGQR